MLLAEIFATALTYWPALLISSFVVYLLRNKFYNGLQRYPGPALASYTNWWRFFENLRRRSQHTYIELHRKYGEVVRVGPNVLSFANPAAIKDIYGLNKGYTKSDFYPVQQAVAKGKRLESMFSTKNEAYHARYRRCVNHAFAMSSLVSYEPLVDSTIKVFLSQTEKLFSNTGAMCNFSRWLQFYAFDVIGEITWSKRLGFVERNEDVDGIVEFLGKFLAYCAPIGQMPWLDLLFEKNPLILFLQRIGFNKSVFPVTKFAQEQSANRAAEMNQIKEKGLESLQKAAQGKPNKGVDLLSKFTQAERDHPDFMNDQRVLTSCVSMIFAGSETTAISLSAVFYFLLQNPAAYRKLMAELDSAVQNGDIDLKEGDGIMSWATSQKLPYLDAVVQETFRLYPAAGLLLERVVPPQGAEIAGERIPGGTIVGCNAWVLHRRPEIFGEDADVYRPERWLEASPAQLTKMKSTMFQFGAGARTCLGKNISLLEMYKLVPSFLLRFEIEVQNRDRPWRTFNAWFVRQLEFFVKFRPRSQPETV